MTPIINFTDSSCYSENSKHLFKQVDPKKSFVICVLLRSIFISLIMRCILILSPMKVSIKLGIRGVLLIFLPNYDSIILISSTKKSHKHCPLRISTGCMKSMSPNLRDEIGLLAINSKLNGTRLSKVMS